MTAGNAILIVAIVTGLGLIGAILFVLFKVRQISQEFFGTPNLVEGLKRQEALEDDTPKSVSGMTRVELPRIEKDFPEFHWPEWKQRCGVVCSRECGRKMQRRQYCSVLQRY